MLVRLLKPSAFILVLSGIRVLSTGYSQELPQRVDALRTLLADTSASVRTHAARELSLWGEEAVAAMPGLLHALVDPDILLRDAALSAVLAVGEPGFPALVHAFSNPDPYINGAAAAAIAKFGARSVPALVQALRSDTHNVRLCSAIALSHMGPQASGAIQALREALSDTSDILRWTACHALRNIGPPAREAVDALLIRTRDADNDVRGAAVAALNAIEPGRRLKRPSRQRVIALVDSLVPRLMSSVHVPGVAVAIIYDRFLAWSRGYGIPDIRGRDSVTPRTMFEACSMSKPVFAYIALKLVEQGNLLLDRPLVDYLPDLFAHERREWGHITARMVLSHTSGLPNWRKGEEERSGPLPLMFHSGSRFGYSGEGFYMLQRVVERIVGEPLERYARRTLFEPLRMSHTSFVWTASTESDQASGHNADGSFLQKTKYVHANAAYSLYTSVEDYARFVCEILTADRSQSHSLSSEMRDTMMSRQVSVRSRDPIERPGRALGSDVFWGLGWSINATPEGDLLHHSGSNRSGFRCFVQFDAQEGTGIVIMTNGVNGGELWEQVIREVGDM